MPKQVNLLPNMRVDIPDFQQQTSGLSVGGRNFLLEQFVQANYSAVIDGFRVEIADQSLSARVLSIHNGVAFDRTGQILNNEDDIAAERSITLPTNGTFYLEVELVQSASDSDARGFWDPTYSNGVDPSGDTRPTGREFTVNVATRLTPDWHIVSPVSTTGFDVTTNPNSTKIPIATLVVSGNVITGATTSALRAVLKKALLTSETKAQFFDTRNMLDSFTLTLDPGGGSAESVTVTANDRENGILTLSSTPSSNHPAGTRAVVAGVSPAQFVTPSSTADKRPRFFQADTDMGFLRGLNPQDNTDPDRARSDLNVDALKAYVDFVANQLQELKFGYFKTASAGGTAPPWKNFDTRSQYYSSAGGVLGARTNTVSIGDGVNSWGDYNVAQYNTNFGGTNFTDCLNAAIAHLTTDLVGGGVIFVKRGTYVANRTTTITGINVTIVGEGRDETKIHSTGAVPPIVFDGGSGGDYGTFGLQLENLSLVVTAGSATSVVNLQDTPRFSARACVLGGISGDMAGGEVTDCVFDTTPRCLDLDEQGKDTTFTNCTFKSKSADVNGRCVYASSMTNVNFQNCTFLQRGVAIDWFVELDTTSQVVFDNCTIQNTNTDTGGAVLINTPRKITFRDCNLVSAKASISAPAAQQLLIDSCKLGIAAGSNVCVQLGDTATNVVIRDNYFEMTGSYDDAQTTYAIAGDNYNRIWVTGNEFVNFDSGVRAKGTVDVEINANVFRCDTGKGRFGVDLRGGIGTLGQIVRTSIRGNSFTNFTADTNDVKPVRILADPTLLTISGLQICDNYFHTIGTIGSLNANTCCVDLTDVDDSARAYGVIVSNNDFNNVQGTNTCFAIQAQWLINGQICNNHCLLVASTVAGTSMTDWAAIRVLESDGVVVNGNVLDGIGAATMGGAGTSGGIVFKKKVADPGNDHNGFIVTNNVLRFIYPNSTSLNGGIVFRDAGAMINCANNNITLSDNGIGILVNDSDTGATSPQSYNIAIANNVIQCSGIASTSGILAEFSRNESLVGGRISITGNALNNYRQFGIAITGADVGVPDNYVIANNSLLSTYTCNAIQCNFVKGFAISGNVVRSTPTTGSHSGISVAGSQLGSISGNSIVLATNTGNAGIDLQDGGNADIMVSGNMISFGTDNLGVVGPGGHARGQDTAGIRLRDDNESASPPSRIMCQANITLRANQGITSVLGVPAGVGAANYNGDAVPAFIGGRGIHAADALFFNAQVGTRAFGVINEDAPYPNEAPANLAAAAQNIDIGTNARIA
jgi:hypothetical protein